MVNRVQFIGRVLAMMALLWSGNAGIAADKLPRSSFERGLELVGAAIADTNYTCWGASPIVSDDGRVHLFVERWPERNVDPAWRKSAEIAHYVADAPEGPFHFRDVALRGTGTNTWDKFAPCNPEIYRFGDTYALLYIANDDFRQPPHPRNQRIGLALAPSLDGPWRKAGRDGLILESSRDTNHWSYGSQVVNPTLIRRGGNFLLYFKSRCQEQAGTVYALAVADKLEGPYVIEGGPITRQGVTLEDASAFVWQDKACLLTTDNHGEMTGIPGGGTLWVSEDGRNFNPAWTQIGFDRIPAYYPAYDAKKTTHFYGGSNPKFERPKVLMRDGQPAFLYAAGGNNVYGGPRTVVYVLRVKLKPGDGPLPTHRASSGTNEVRLTVMSFNILEAGGNAASVGFPDSAFGGSRRDDIANVIRECGADFVGVQECGPVAPLLEELGPDWHGLGTGKSVYTGAIVSRLPIEPLVAEDFLTAARVKLPAGGSVVLVNTHWSPLRNSGVWLIQQRLLAGTIPADLSQFEAEILAASDASSGPRGYRHTLDVLRPLLKAGENVILAGDFNESSHLDWTARAATNGMDRWVKNPTGRPLRFKVEWRGSKLLVDAGLRDAYRTAFSDEVTKPGVTWTPPYPVGTPGRRPHNEQVLERMDMIYFAGKELKVFDAGIVGESKATSELAFNGPWVSDHRAVIGYFFVETNSKP